MGLRRLHLFPGITAQVVALVLLVLVRALVQALDPGLGQEVGVEAGAGVEVEVKALVRPVLHLVPPRRVVLERSLEVSAQWCWVLSGSLHLV